MKNCDLKCIFQKEGECWFACADKIYNQGRADCLREAHRFADQESYKEGYKRGIEKGKAEMIKEFLTKLCTCIPFVSLQDEIECRKIFYNIAKELEGEELESSDEKME